MAGQCTGANTSKGGCDLDSFNGDINALNDMTGNTPTLPTPTIKQGFLLGKGLGNGTWQVTVDCPNPGAQIYYTTDGTTPTTDSFPYTGAINVSGSQQYTLMAAAYEDGYNPSAVAAQRVANIADQSEPYNPASIGDPSFVFSIAGQSGGYCVVQTSTDLSNWVSISTNLLHAIAPSNFIGLATFSNTILPSDAMRFYRTFPLITNQSYTINISPGLNLIANQLDHGSNTLGELFPNPTGARDGDQIEKYNADGTYSVWVFNSTSLTGFSDSGGNSIAPATLFPGEGAFYNNVHTSGLITFTGTPHVPGLPAVLPYGCGSTNLLSSQTPDAASYDSIVGLAPAEGSQLQRWTPSQSGPGFFTTYSFTSGAWTPVEPPPLNVGESALVVVPCTAAPGIARQPTSLTLAQGAMATFTAAPNIQGPVSYQWQFDGVDIGGATQSNYVVTNVSLSTLGGYSVTITNQFGSAHSTVATLSLAAFSPGPPTVVQNPTNVIAAAGGSAKFFVWAAGMAPLVYQWQFDGTNIGGATARSYMITNVQPFNTGGYRVVVANSFGSVTSAVASLSIGP